MDPENKPRFSPTKIIRSFRNKASQPPQKHSVELVKNLNFIPSYPKQYYRNRLEYEAEVELAEEALDYSRVNGMDEPTQDVLGMMEQVHQGEEQGSSGTLTLEEEQLLELQQWQGHRHIPYDNQQPRYYSDSRISYNNNNNNYNNNNILKASECNYYWNNSHNSSHKWKKFDGVPVDFKLQVLQWAYSKTIHSAGHHFNLERCVVRHWMMNEDKIYKCASEKAKTKWRNFDSRVLKHFEWTRPIPENAAETSIIHGLGDLTF